jgi:diguanylate cyclase (GGDEF)-like protein
MSAIWVIVGVVCTAAILKGVNYLLGPVQAQQAARAALAERTSTVDRLLDFSQTIQGAGKPDQVFATLTHFLRTELKLSGLAILTTEAETVPPTQLRSAWPDGLVAPSALSDLDNATCPCLRQSLPRTFRPEGSPVRCAIDSALKLPTDHPAFCIPFSIGRKMQAVVHMLMPPGSEWTEKHRQLAQTYVNSAQSVLTTLQLLNEAEKQSMTDALTGLYNRRSMENLLEREVALCERHNHALSLVMIDLDHFKQINDTHGHAAGDHMLRAFADCVRITLRKTDLAFRYGGDEFVIALPQTPLYQAQQVVNKLRQAFLSVDFSHAITHLDKHPTLSIGVAERSKAGNILTLATILAAADQALYAAKNSNRNCVKVFEPPQAA